MDVLATYDTPAGPREIVLVRKPDGGRPFVLLDVAVNVYADGQDPLLVEDQLHSVDEALALTRDYLAHGVPVTEPLAMAA